MRTIKVKPGSSKYKLKGEDGALIGELVIAYNTLGKTCSIDIAKKGVSIKELAIREMT